MTKASLFDLAGQYQQLLELGSSTDPDDQQIFLDTLEGLSGEIAQKTDAYYAVRARLLGRRETVKQEIDRLTAVLKTIDGNVTRMDDSALRAMDIMGVTELRGDLHKYKKVRNGGKAPLVIDGVVPGSYQKVILAPDNDRIRAALEAGEQLDFAHLGERGTHLKIT